MKTKITTFIFDCFGVICSSVISNWYEENKLKKGFSDDNFKNVLKEFDLGNLSESDLAEYFSKYKGVNSTKEKLQKDIDSYLKINRTLVEIIQDLKSKGFKTVLLSNGNASFFKRKVYIMYPDFENLFDEIVISSEVGMLKPNKEIFLYTLKKINSTPEEILFIDDNKQNTDGATLLGINGYVYTDNNSFLDYIKKLGINL